MLTHPEGPWSQFEFHSKLSRELLLFIFCFKCVFMFASMSTLCAGACGDLRESDPLELE